MSFYYLVLKNQDDVIYTLAKSFSKENINIIFIIIS